MKKRQDDGGFRRLDLSANIITMHWLQLVTRWRTLWSFVRRSGAMPFPRYNVCTVGREHGDGGRIKRQTLAKNSRRALFPPSICPTAFGLNCLISIS